MWQKLPDPILFFCVFIVVLERFRLVVYKRVSWRWECGSGQGKSNQQNCQLWSGLKHFFHKNAVLFVEFPLKRHCLNHFSLKPKLLVTSHYYIVPDTPQHQHLSLSTAWRNPRQQFQVFDQIKQANQTERQTMNIVIIYSDYIQYSVNRIVRIIYRIYIYVYITLYILWKYCTVPL